MISKRLTEEENSVAEKELDCALDCLLLIELNLGKGKFSKALTLINDLQKSINTLKKLSEEKAAENQVVGILKKLSSIGVDTETVKKLIKKS